MDIRAVKKDDATRVVEIYNYYVKSTSISFEEALLSVEIMQNRIDDVTKLGLPWLVMELDGKVVGYAYASQWKSRSAYRYTVEPSIYLDTQATGKGLGMTLYSALLETLRDRHFQNAIGVIALPNPASIQLHERLGFKKVGEFSNIGVKFGEKKSVGYWQLALDDPTS